mmetsp:Transcript_6289/g.15628  ORF Transcript_6289/g.15628 Transcript_6289/m.15628 type:complete len:142 (-) Transcript_6289:183-608(-)
MGAETSTNACSVSRPLGCVEYGRDIREGTCSGKRELTKMEVATVDAIEQDHINSWTKDLQQPGLRCCGPPPTTAPKNYFAETQGHGCIVMDVHEGPVLLAECGEDYRIIGLHPEEDADLFDSTYGTALPKKHFRASAPSPG